MQLQCIICFCSFPKSDLRTMEKLQLIKALKQMAAYSIVVFQPAVRVPYFTFISITNVKNLSAKLKKIMSILHPITDILVYDQSFYQL